MGFFSKSETQRFLSGLDRRMASSQAWLETPDGRLLIVKSDYKRHWSVPGGIIDAGETPLQAVKREVLEEVGIDLAYENYTMMLAASRHSSRGLSYQFIFKASLPPDYADVMHLQTSEIEEAAFVTKAEALGDDRNYGHAIVAWAEGTTGYAEFILD